MSKERGWICLFRDITEHWTWTCKPFSQGQAWIHLLLMANHKDNTILFDGKPLLVERGTFVTSISKLSNVFGWDRKKTTKFLNNLEIDKMVTTKRTTHGTTITIVNYNVYQNMGITRGITDGITEGQPRDNQGATEGQPRDINNNDNNEDHDNYDNNNICADATRRKNSQRFIPPAIEEIKAYCKEKGLHNVNAEEFFYFYSSKDWMVGKNKMKNWKSAVSGWNSRNQNNMEPKSSKPANGGNKSFKEIMMEMEQSEQQEDVYVESKDITERSSNEY